MPSWRCCACLCQKHPSKERQRKVSEPYIYPKIRSYFRKYQREDPPYAVSDSDFICSRCYLAILHSSGALPGPIDTVDLRKGKHRTPQSVLVSEVNEPTTLGTHISIFSQFCFCISNCF